MFRHGQKSFDVLGLDLDLDLGLFWFWIVQWSSISFSAPFFSLPCFFLFRFHRNTTLVVPCSGEATPFYTSSSRHRLASQLLWFSSPHFFFIFFLSLAFIVCWIVHRKKENVTLESVQYWSVSWNVILIEICRKIFMAILGILDNLLVALMGGILMFYVKPWSNLNLMFVYCCYCYCTQKEKIPCMFYLIQKNRIPISLRVGYLHP